MIFLTEELSLFLENKMLFDAFKMQNLSVYASLIFFSLLYSPIELIMSFFGNSIGFIHSNGLMGIGFSLFVVGIASLNLVLDFNFIHNIILSD